MLQVVSSHLTIWFKLFTEPHIHSQGKLLLLLFNEPPTLCFVAVLFREGGREGGIKGESLKGSAHEVGSL